MQCLASDICRDITCFCSMLAANCASLGEEVLQFSWVSPVEKDLRNKEVYAPV